METQDLRFHVPAGIGNDEAALDQVIERIDEGYSPGIKIKPAGLSDELTEDLIAVLWSRRKDFYEASFDVGKLSGLDSRKYEGAFDSIKRVIEALPEKISNVVSVKMGEGIFSRI